MLQIAKVHLRPDSWQATRLKRTLERANAACNYVSKFAWEKHIFGQYHLHQALYHTVRRESGLSAQMVVRCIARVAAAYKMEPAYPHAFQLLSPIPYDDRILTWRLYPQEVSIWANGRRETIPFVCGRRQEQLLATQQGQSDLILLNNEFFLFTACNVEDLRLIDVTDVMT
jgi:putative transposase